MKSMRRLAVGLGVALSMLALGAPAASATSGSVTSRVWTSPDIQPDANDPGGRVTAYLKFNSRYVMHVNNVILDDICPGDGHAVYWFLEADYTLENKKFKGPAHWSSGECDSPNERWNSQRFETTVYQIQKARLWVCVNVDEDGGIDLNGDNDSCNQTGWRDNPYT